MSAGDDAALAFMEKEKHVWTNTVKLKDLVGREGEFAGMFFVGGHGRMYSFLFFSFCFFFSGWVFY
jgi:putative intracellular protease/amidase